MTVQDAQPIPWGELNNVQKIVDGLHGRLTRRGPLDGRLLHVAEQLRLAGMGLRAEVEERRPSRCE